MSTALALLPLVALGQGRGGSEADRRAWFEGHYRRATSVRVGMSRMAFERLYEPDGGLQTIPPTRYVYRDLPYFKVEVSFDRGRNRLARIGPIELSGKVHR